MEDESPERPATQRAPSLHSSRVAPQTAGDATSSDVHPPSTTRESGTGNQERLLSRANFNSEVLIDDGRLYLFENVEFSGYARR